MTFFMHRFSFLILVTIFLSPAFAWDGAVDPALEREIARRFAAFQTEHTSNIIDRHPISPAVLFLEDLTGALLSESDPGEQANLIRMIQAVLTRGAGVGGIRSGAAASEQERELMIEAMIVAAVRDTASPPPTALMGHNPHQSVVFSLAQQARELLGEVRTPPPSYSAFLSAAGFPAWLAQHQAFDQQLVGVLSRLADYYNFVYSPAAAPNLLPLISPGGLEFLGSNRGTLGELREERLKAILDYIRRMNRVHLAFLSFHPTLIAGMDGGQTWAIVREFAGYTEGELAVIETYYDSVFVGKSPRVRATIWNQVWNSLPQHHPHPTKQNNDLLKMRLELLGGPGSLLIGGIDWQHEAMIRAVFRCNAACLRVVQRFYTPIFKGKSYEEIIALLEYASGTGVAEQDLEKRLVFLVLHPEFLKTDGTPGPRLKAFLGFSALKFGACETNYDAAVSGQDDATKAAIGEHIFTTPKDDLLGAQLQLLAACPNFFEGMRDDQRRRALGYLDSFPIKDLVYLRAHHRYLMSLGERERVLYLGKVVQEFKTGGDHIETILRRDEERFVSSQRR